MSTDTPPLSPRHERFVAEYLKDGNATRAYVRAGYSARGAQQSASKLLRRPQVEAAVAVGRQRILQSLEVTVTRTTQEYAKIAFASVDDFVSVDEAGLLRIDLEKANLAQRGGIVALTVRNHGKQQQSVTLKLGKLQALAALTRILGVREAKPPDPARDLAADIAAGRRRAWGDERPLAEAPPTPTPDDRPPDPPHEPEPPDPPEEPLPPIVLQGLGPPDPPCPRRRPAAPPGMPTQPPPDCIPGHLRGQVFWNTDHPPPPGPTWIDFMRTAKPGGFPGR